MMQLLVPNDVPKDVPKNQQKEFPKKFPKDVSNILFKMKHEMDFSDILMSLKLSCWDWDIRSVELAFQAHARDGLIIVEQYSGGVVGQKVSILPRNSRENGYEVGYSWRSYDRMQMDELNQWGLNMATCMGEGCTKESWFEKKYGTWKEYIGNGLVRVRLMIEFLPGWSEFSNINQAKLFNIFPGFLPITVIIPSTCVVSVVVPLNQSQLAVKYNFEEDIIFTNEKVEKIRQSECQLERNRIFTELMEFFIIKPTMLIHNYRIRDVIYVKLEEWNDQWNDDSKYIDDLMDRMKNVLSIILQDPLYVEPLEPLLLNELKISSKLDQN